MKTLTQLVVISALFIAAPLAALQKQGSLGSKDPGLFNLKGTIYFLPSGTERMPDTIARMKPEGVIYTDRLDVPARDFNEGFPGVTSRFEWFGVIYTGRFEVDKPGEYTWRILSDDGSRLWIDDKELIDNDSIQGSTEKSAPVTLSKGPHTIKVWYFQGPATEIALQLFVQPPGADEKVFVMGDFAGGLKAAISKVQAAVTADGICARLDAGILFDTAKSDLKPAARDTLQALVELMASSPTATVRIDGHTDSVGDDASNQKLSEARALSVRAAVVAAGAPKTVTFQTRGLGESKPVASNDTDAGRAQNRRVEVCIRP